MFLNGVFICQGIPRLTKHFLEFVHGSSVCLLLAEICWAFLHATSESIIMHAHAYELISFIVCVSFHAIRGSLCTSIRHPISTVTTIFRMDVHIVMYVKTQPHGVFARYEGIIRTIFNMALYLRGHCVPSNEAGNSSGISGPKTTIPCCISWEENVSGLCIWILGPFGVICCPGSSGPPHLPVLLSKSMRGVPGTPDNETTLNDNAGWKRQAAMLGTYLET